MMTKYIALAALSFTLAGCYNYYPVGQQPGKAQPPAQAGQASTGGQPAAVPGQGQTPSPNGGMTLPPAQASTPAGQTDQSGPDSQSEEKIATAVKGCSDRIPDVAGRKAELVRCIVEATDTVMNAQSPQWASQRHALSAYAIQLAEREDKGEITREQAESYYQQFLQRTPGYGQAPLQASSVTGSKTP